MKGSAAKKKKEPAPPKADASTYVAEVATVDLNNSSIQTGPETINTIAGPIHEWLPVPENLPNHPTLAFFGKRRTGKSTTITNILFHCCQDIPFGIVMSDTAYAGTFIVFDIFLHTIHAQRL